MGFLPDGIKRAWSAFNSREPTGGYYSNGIGYTRNPSRTNLHLTNEQTIIASIYTRLAIDVSEISIQHVRLDKDGQLVERINGSLNKRLNNSANIDQTGRAFILDVAMSLFDEGVVAVVPVRTDTNPDSTGGIEYYELRVGKIEQWYPDQVRVSVYNEETALRESITMDKSALAIIENPMYAVMNEFNSTTKRLVSKLALSDKMDSSLGNDKMNIIIQLPYTLRGDLAKAQADERLKSLEYQMANSPYGITYISATEKITQLNRPAENNLMSQIEYLTAQLFNQLGMTEEVFNGTADEQTTLNYFGRSITPVLNAICESISRAFLSQEQQDDGQAVKYYRNMFKLMTALQLSAVANNLIRNELLTANEFRTGIGYIRSKDARADTLRNPNMPADKDLLPEKLEGENQNGTKNIPQSKPQSESTL